MKYIFLVNSFSLKKETEPIINRIKVVADELKLDYKIEVNSINESTEDILKKYKDTKNIIICLGGDGTINRTLNGIVNTNNILGYIPYGTGNDFYRANKELLKKGINDIDLVKINDKYFINVTCFGIDADIGNTEEVVHSKFIPRSQRYNMAIIRHFLKYKARHMKVIINGEEVYDSDYTTVAVCNARYYGGGYKVAPNASLDDALLDVYLVDKLPKINMIKTILAMKKGNHEKNKSVKLLRASSLTIESKEDITCNMDGDKLTSKFFDIRLIPKGIKVYYDQDLIDRIQMVKKK